MSKHTPGPWTYSVYVNHYERPELAGWAASVYQDDDCHEDNICAMRSDFDKETTEANATLIAAAPDLLSACEAAMRIESLWYPANAGGPVEDPENHEAYALYLMREKFSAAIAKATNQKETAK